jgi:tetratricopeptide (TPR) repeat protein
MKPKVAQLTFVLLLLLAAPAFAAQSESDLWQQGYWALDKGNYDLAISSISAILKSSTGGDLTPMYIYRGRAYQAKGDYDKAMADYNEAILLKPRFPEAYFYRGNAYGLIHEYDKAIADYNQVLGINPSLMGAFSNRGMAYEAEG